MSEIIFKDNSIQTGHRIKIPKAVIDTLEWREGQKIKIRFGIDERILIIEEDKGEKMQKGRKGGGRK